MRICTLLPSATEICYALGLGDSVLGVTHECDFPPEARQKRVVVTSRLPHTTDSAEIDRLVTEFTSRGESVYRVDAEALREIDPDLIITQDLCHVCAASPDDLAAALSSLPRMPKVLSLNAHTLDEVWADVIAVGAANNREKPAANLVEYLKDRVASVQRAVQPFIATRARPRIACLEWLNPVFNAGHWVPEMVALAGGEDVLAHAGKPSVRMEWQQVFDARPDVILISPCGYDLKKATDEFSHMQLPNGWNDLPAVKSGRVYVTDANSYLSRPGPRLAEGVAILAKALHPDLELQIPEGSLMAIGRASGVFA
jgi:iron complex transport system substrate-binding protein|nr:cobalamin-binding protein [Candidatus Acidoferrales bacterium]